MVSKDILTAINGVLKATLSSISKLPTSLSTDVLEDWSKSVLRTKGRVVFTGVGKSGLIAQKASSTMASLGTKSLFVHPMDAMHGDLGNLESDDHLVALSSSGESDELLKLFIMTERLGIETLLLTANSSSSLAKQAKWVLNYSIEDGEGSPNGLSAPMASSTAQLVICDVLSAVLASLRGFTSEMFAYNHPGGSIGAKLMKVSEVMSVNIASHKPNSKLLEILKGVSQGKNGIVMITDETNKLTGVVTDGDIRRLIEAKGNEALEMSAGDFMTLKPITIAPNASAIEAAELMARNKITVVCVADNTNGEPLGVIHIHDLIRLKIL